MPSTLTSDPKPTSRHDDLDSYDVDDPFADPFDSPPPDASSKKRKEPESGLGIDEEVSVQKRARVPNVKLDEERLLGPKGLPKLRARAHTLKIKGKGHEFSDASRLLSFYQLWLDDLFPKAKFLDALAMVEKAGHKKQVMIARNDLIQEGRPKDPADDEQPDDDDIFGDITNSTRMEPRAPTASETQRPKTPERRDIPSDEDIYDATPRARPVVPVRHDDEPDADDLEALMAEAEGQDQPKDTRPIDPGPDIDDLDALIAEAEINDQTPTSSKPAGGASDDFADEEAAMQEMDGLW